MTQAPSIPELPGELRTEASALGAPTAAYRSGGAGCIFPTVAWCVLTGGLFFMWAGYMVITDPKTPPRDHWIGYTVAGLVGLPILAGGWWLRRRFKVLGTMRAWVMPGGLAWTSAAGHGVSSWDDLVELYVDLTRIYRNGSLLRECYRYTVLDAKGRRALFSEFMPGVEELGRTLEREMGQRLLPRAVSRVEAGETLAFGPLQLGKDGLKRGSATLPWKDLGEAGVQAGYLNVQNKNGSSFCSVKVATIPNFMVLMTLVNALAKGK